MLYDSSSEEASEPGLMMELDEGIGLYNSRQIITHRFESGDLYYLCQTISGEEWIHAKDMSNDQECVSSYWDRANAMFYSREEIGGTEGCRNESLELKQHWSAGNQCYYLADCEFGADCILEGDQIPISFRLDYAARDIQNPDHWK